MRGGSLSVDFANTVDWTEDDSEVEATDALIEDDSLDRWGTRMGVFGNSSGPVELELARGLRGALHRIFSALARSEAPDAFSCPEARSAYAQGVAAGALAQRAGGLRLGVARRRALPRALRGGRGRRRPDG